MSSWEEVERLKKEICEILTKRVKESLNYEEVKKRTDLEKELSECKALVQRAKRSKDQLQEYYAEKRRKKSEAGKVASEEEFGKMKKEYFE